MNDTRLYRSCVGIALFNTQGKVFVGERHDSPGAWQMPQGGIDQGESLEQAFYREMKEEIGTDKADILKIHEEKLRYDIPVPLSKKLWEGQYKGQEQTWIAARFTGIDQDIDINADATPEFLNWQWAPLSEIISMIVPFKKDIYSQVISAFEPFARISDR